MTKCEGNQSTSFWRTPSQKDFGFTFERPTSSCTSQIESRKRVQKRLTLQFGSHSALEFFRKIYFRKCVARETNYEREDLGEWQHQRLLMLSTLWAASANKGKPYFTANSQRRDENLSLLRLWSCQPAQTKTGESEKSNRSGCQEKGGNCWKLKASKAIRYFDSDGSIMNIELIRLIRKLIVF